MSFASFFRSAGAILSLAFAGSALAQSGDDGCTRAGLTLCIRFEPAPETRFGCTPALPCPDPDRREIFRRILVQSGSDTVTWYALNKASPFPPGDRADDTSRIALVDGATLNGGAADGNWAIMLTTQDRDDCVHASCGAWERSMMQISKKDTAASEGVEQWWAHSVYLPADFAMPPNGPPGPHFEAVLFLQFHRSWAQFPGGNQPMIALELFRQPGARPHTVFRVRTHGANGTSNMGNVQYTYSVPGRRSLSGQCLHDNPANGVWYHFIHHIRFSATNGGFHRMWLREGNNPVKKVLDKKDINALFTTSEESYLSIGTYHDRHYGASTSVIHDRIRRGTSYEAVKRPDFPAALPGAVQMCEGATVP